LNCDHERQGQKHRPQQPEAELRAGLRIGGDARRIVVGCAGDEAGTKPLQQRLPGFCGRVGAGLLGGAVWRSVRQG
jgi:hypothetical protein